MKAAVFLAGVAFAEGADPERPHLAQAWTAMSMGDGLPGTVGLEHYIYEPEDKSAGRDMEALQAHIWDYGSSCKKIELNTPNGAQPRTSDYRWGTYYINCDSVDCCYSGRGSTRTRPDVKQWDINTPGVGGIVKVKFEGYNASISELNNNPVKNAEHWHETDKAPFPQMPPVEYHHYITRNATADGEDIISHRIDYTAGAAAPPGTIVYGNFTVIHDVKGFRETFKIPDMCSPQGNPPGKGHALACDGEQMESWEQKYFKHSYAMKSLAKSSVVV